MRGNYYTTACERRAYRRLAGWSCGPFTSNGRGYMPVARSLVSRAKRLAVQLTHIRFCVLELTILRGLWSVPARHGWAWLMKAMPSSPAAVIVRWIDARRAFRNSLLHHVGIRRASNDGQHQCIKIRSYINAIGDHAEPNRAQQAGSSFVGIGSGRALHMSKGTATALVGRQQRRPGVSEVAYIFVRTTTD